MTTPLALYIHWPFCLSKCPYCDFNSHVRESYSERDWLQALQTELTYMAAQTGPQQLHSLFFGGGTPSLMSPQTVEAVINTAQQLWPTSENLEITLEANPNSVERDKFQNFARAGINRISVGIQALNHADLKSLGRTHVEEALQAIDVAANTFERYSFDLIYARPDQTVEAWEQELTYALSLAGSHLSLYQLTIEPGTAFEKLHQRGDLVVPNDVASETLYTHTQRLMKAAGLPAYEVSNHAVRGQECLHNLIYWRYQDYVGVGPGAHGRMTVNGEKIATQCVKAPELWLDAVKAKGHGIHRQETIPAEDQQLERLMMGLRLSEGVVFDAALQAALPEKKLQDLVDEKLLVIEKRRLCATTAGRLRLNGVLGYLV